MATAPKKSFHVTVRGQYQAYQAGSSAPSLKGYEETFILPTQEAALSTVCKHLLAPRLRKQYPDYIRFRTHELVGITLTNYVPNKEVLQMGIDDMNIKELHDFCILRQIMIDPFEHSKDDIFKLRAMVQTAYTEKRALQKENLTSKEGVDTKQADVLRQANDLPPVGADPVININEQKITNAARAEAAAVAPAHAQASAPLEADEPLPPVEPDADPFS